MLSEKKCNVRQWSIALAVLFGGLCILYAQVYAFAPLTYDDPYYLAKNAVADQSLVSTSFWQGLLGNSSLNLWTPLTDLTHQLLFRISEKPAIHLAFNALLHGINATLLFLCVYRFSSDKLLALAVSLLFAWHPITVESVAWISGRKDLLSTFFILLAVFFYIRSPETVKVSQKVRLFLLMVAACMSKPIAIVLPLLLLFIDYWPLQQKKSFVKLAIEKWFLWVTSIGFALHTVYVQSIGTQSMTDSRTMLVKLSEALWATMKSLSSIAWPNNLHLSYSNPDQLSLESILLLVMVGLALLGVLVWKRNATQPLLSGLLWYCVALGPTLGLIRAGNNLAADRYSYIPIIGILLALAGMCMVFKKEKCYKLMLSLGYLFAVILLVISFFQVSHWRSQEALFSHTLECDPNNVNAREELAYAALQNNDIGQVQQLLNPVLKEYPNSPGAHLILGQIAFTKGEYKAAYTHYQVAAALRSSEAFIQERLAASAHGMGDLEKTKHHLTSAIKLAVPSDKNLDLHKKWSIIFPNISIPK